MSNQIQPLPDGVQASAVGLVIPDTINLDELLQHLSTLDQGLMWWWGDYCLACERTFQKRIDRAGERETTSLQTRMHLLYERLGDQVGRQPGTIKRATYVARAFALNDRRASLSFTYHREVVALDDPDEWLDRVEAEGWSVSDLRVAIRQANAIQGQEDDEDDGPGSTEIVQVYSHLTDFRRGFQRVWPTLTTETRTAWLTELREMLRELTDEERQLLAPPR